MSTQFCKVKIEFTLPIPKHRFGSTVMETQVADVLAGTISSVLNLGVPEYQTALPIMSGDRKIGYMTVTDPQ